MRAKSLLLLTIAAGCGTVASIGVSQVIMERRGTVAEETPTTEIFVAVREIDANQKITPDLVRLEKWPQNRLPEGIVVKLDEVDGRYARQRVFAGEPILAGKMSAGPSGRDRAIPAGYRVFDLPVDERKGAAGHIQPGDFVDVHGIFKLDGASESQPVVLNVRIYGVNGVTSSDEGAKAVQRATTFQLLVTEKQLEALNLASALGDLRCSLRPPAEEGGVAKQDVDTGAGFVAWVRAKDGGSAEKVKLAGPSAFEPPPVLPVTAFPPAVEESKKELLIITPSGVTKYQWNRDDEIPHRVDDPHSPAPSPTVTGMVTPLTVSPAVMAPAAGAAGTLITPFGFGGYAPTYPGAEDATDRKSGKSKAAFD
jgi:pilus assembly protein CpaB